VTIRDTLISRRHTRITLRDGVYLVEDLLSANGTFVNGQKLTAPQPLQDGDQIAIGDTVLIFRQGKTAPAAIDEQPLSTGLPAGPLPGMTAPPIDLSRRSRLLGPPKPRRP